jgi:hypothetical protein
MVQYWILKKLFPQPDADSCKGIKTSTLESSTTELTVPLQDSPPDSSKFESILGKKLGKKSRGNQYLILAVELAKKQ